MRRCDTEMVQDRSRDELAPHRVDVAVAVARLLVGEEALGHEDLQLVLGAGHGDVEQAAGGAPPSSAGEPVAMSEGMQPSTALRTYTECHSWPLAEWMVQRMIVFVELLLYQSLPPPALTSPALMTRARRSMSTSRSRSESGAMTRSWAARMGGRRR